jgi:hypothetical protein
VRKLAEALKVRNKHRKKEETMGANMQVFRVWLYVDGRGNDDVDKDALECYFRPLIWSGACRCDIDGLECNCG